MWKCAKCETINEGETCLICGATREEYQNIPEPEPAVRQEPQVQQNYTQQNQQAYQQAPAYTAPVYTQPAPAPVAEPVKKKKKKGLIATVIVLVSLLVLAGGAFGFLEYKYSAGTDALKRNKVDEARDHFNMISFYRDSADKLVECDYVQAKLYLNEGKYEEAAETFRALGDYKDSERQISKTYYRQAEELFDNEEYSKAKEIFADLGDYDDAESRLYDCDYFIAGEALADGDYETARNIYENLEGVGRYVELELEECDLAEVRSLIEDGSLLDAYNMLDEMNYYGDEFDNLEADLYASAVEDYNGGYYTSAKDEFTALGDYQYAEEYIRLINIRQSANPTISSIYDIIYFAPTKELLMENEYLHLFLVGTWKGGIYELLFKPEGGCTTTNIPLTNSGNGRYKIEDGKHYIMETNKTEYEHQWTYTIVDKRTIKITCVKDGLTIGLYRQ